ncbi:glutamyl-tRNA amidotransferas-like protein subunit B [Hyaloscypha variabilis F]|uniref:Glutamyl-tRNA(Gln) amidotransferase subunit B, mitochondrial n=1 Tax=Hyaloscypha variabilis (strain UAMH 11265 / GT02V1 / F) TaxID=1149755 RepID=A0A2J6RU14_HYAVF|nr:glutamyl-tRNA amidotransferas-like protein subunit B [Hyaloscypha variabilis F]
MARIPPSVLRRYLFGGHLPTGGCLRPLRHCRPTAYSLSAKRYHGTQVSNTSAGPGFPETTIPFRKQLKDEAKKRKAEGTGKKSKQDNQKLDDWELTVGIEIHAQLNTARKLFSAAASSINDTPNTHVALFDVAMPGSQPTFQKETLIPALRAALALNCEIQKTSRFDRKHYFHWDQPAGYQITQYYEPFARDGYITLYAHDGIAAEDGEEVRIGIKQIQMEQDTAKTISQPGDIHLLDFNRVGLPLIEIITLPQIHHPSTAAALVRKVQILLNAVDACVLGMQSGGLRADVNVSVRRRDSTSSSTHSYGGIQGLGQRTEIKNLSSFKAVEDAIIAERDRQISVLESGGVIEGETRGWTIGSSETKRLRGKEGEVDYRYMPDPDLAPVVIGEDLIEHLRSTMGVLPDEEILGLTNEYGLTTKDAMSLVSLNEGGRVEYFMNVVDEYLLTSAEAEEDLKAVGRLIGNWVLHEMGGLTHDLADEENPLNMTPEGDCVIPAKQLAELVRFLSSEKITGRTAKKVLSQLFAAGLTGKEETAEGIIEREGLWFTPLSEAEYAQLATDVLGGNTKVVEEILAGKAGKINFLVGQVMRADQDGRVDATKARVVVVKLIEEQRRSAA